MRRLYFSLMLFSLAACGRQPENHIIKSDIQSTRTGKHVNIPGTRLFIIPPPGFTVSKTLPLLQKDEQSTINIVEVVGRSFNIDEANLTKTVFEQQGGKVLDYKQVKVNGYTAMYLSMEAVPDDKLNMLVFGDASFSTTIMGVCTASDESTGKQIITALNTIYYDKNKKIDPLE